MMPRRILTFLNCLACVSGLIASGAVLPATSTPQISGTLAPTGPIVDSGPTSARAPFWGDIKVYSGIECRPLLVQGADFIVEPVGIKNTGFGNLNVVCPVVRDNTKNTSGMPSAQINVWNATSGVNFHCVFYNYDLWGLITTLDSADTSLVGQRTLSFKLYTSNVGGYYTIFCIVPPGSKIYSYQVIEELETDPEPW